MSLLRITAIAILGFASLTCQAMADMPNAVAKQVMYTPPYGVPLHTAIYTKRVDSNVTHPFHLARYYYGYGLYRPWLYRPSYYPYTSPYSLAAYGGYGYGFPYSYAGYGSFGGFGGYGFGGYGYGYGGYGLNSYGYAYPYGAAYRPYYASYAYPYSYPYAAGWGGLGSSYYYPNYGNYGYGYPGGYGYGAGYGGMWGGAGMWGGGGMGMPYYAGYGGCYYW